jgi:hypothetical protein
LRGVEEEARARESKTEYEPGPLLVKLTPFNKIETFTEPGDGAAQAGMRTFRVSIEATLADRRISTRVSKGQFVSTVTLVVPPLT